MRSIKYPIISIIFLLAGSCISPFIPEINETQEMVVVEGLITDQPGINVVKLSRSVPLNKAYTSNPLKGCTVTINDDAGNTFTLSEISSGTYITDSPEFQGVIGRKYQLKIKINDSSSPNKNYESALIEMKPVPPIDSLYYKKVTLKQREDLTPVMQGCQVFLSTHDQSEICKYYRWDYKETWQFQLPYDVPNNICWISNNSSEINIKTTTSLSENRIEQFPITFISNKTDRLNKKYSLLVNQYSMNEDEYDYWSKLQSIFEETGSLYDITPSSIIGNIYCIDDPGEEVLGYFSVSAKTSKRIFIKDYFAGLPNLYIKCPTDTVFNNDTIPGLNQTIWVIMTVDYAMPPYKVLTTTKTCADCTARGSKIKPVFWEDD